VATRCGTEVNAPGGQIYPVTLDQDRTGRTLLHWTTRPYKPAPASSQSQEPNVMICAVPSACR
jgi:hypothetical protein